MNRWWMVSGLLCLVDGGLPGGDASAAPQPQPTLLTDRLGQPQDLVPTSAEIAAAKTALGAAGLYRDCGLQLEQ